MNSTKWYSNVMIQDLGWEYIRLNVVPCHSHAAHAQGSEDFEGRRSKVDIATDASRAEVGNPGSDALAIVYSL